MSTSIAVVYHSGYGHTEVVAQAVAEGASTIEGIEVTMIAATDIDSPESPALAKLDAADAMIFGSPTYMGSASAVFKGFMEATSTRWMEQKWADKLGAGFTNSGSMNGDKQNTLIEFFTFAIDWGKCRATTIQAGLKLTATDWAPQSAACLKPTLIRGVMSPLPSPIAKRPVCLEPALRGPRLAGKRNDRPPYLRSCR